MIVNSFTPLGLETRIRNDTYSLMYVRYIIDVLLRAIGALIKLIGRILCWLLFAFLVLGTLYYYMKPQLPPQEIWELLGEFLPSQVATVENSSMGKNILPLLEIDMWQSWTRGDNTVDNTENDWSDTLTWAVLTWDLVDNLNVGNGVVQTSGGIVITTQWVNNK